MRYGVLGAVQVWRADGSLVPVGGPGPRALLALLLLDAGRVVGPERLIDGLYGEHPPGGAANALQSQVSRLRRGLRAGGPADPAAGAVVELHPAGYRLAVEPDDVDAHRFERLARAGHEALAGGDPAAAAAVLGEALGLWRGPALADVAGAPFAAAAAARLEQLRVAAVEDRAEAELARGAARAVLAELQDLAAAYPLRERARALLMRALHGSGRSAEALLVFDDARRVLADELGADPSAELAGVHLAVLRAGPAIRPPPSPPPSPAPSPAPAPLPAQLTSFVGRVDELERIGKLLAAGRLVTLTGPGGAGKTRLAVEAAGREHGEVCFVDLAPLGTGPEVPAAVLAALGLRESGLFPSGGSAQPAADRLVPALAGRRLLLILDNCEHVLDDAARFAHRLLGGCPQLRVLATSREPLGIIGEALCPVPPLPLPAPGTAVVAAVGYPAVRLFTDRAAAVRPDFAVDAGSLDAVLRICTALDGLPLAIELAAARLRSLPIGEVAGRLDDRFRLLSRGDRTAPLRHRTLRAVVGWSWDLLDDAERVLARRLTVFAGGATPAAVGRVCGLPAAEVGDLLAGLVDKSLVEATPADAVADGGGASGMVAGGGDRYRMLETVRAFGAEQLDAAGETGAFRRAHAAYFLDLAETAEPWLRRAEQLDWLARLDAEHGNLQAALRWAVPAEPALALRLLAALSWYWFLRGRRSESGPPAVELLRRLGTDPPAGLAEEYVLCVLTAVAGGAVPRQQLAEHLARAESIMRGLDRPTRRPSTHVLWAVASGPPPPDEDIAARRQAQIGTDPWSAALVDVSTAFLALFAGEPAAAEAAFGRALAQFRGLGDRYGMGMALGQLGELAGWRGDRTSAVAQISAAVELAAQLGAGEDLADLYCRRAEVLARGGDLAAARADYEFAVDAARLAGSPALLAAARCGQGEVARLGGDLAGSRRLLDAALAGAVAGSFETDLVRARALVALGHTAAVGGTTAEAGACYRQALGVALRRSQQPTAAGAVEGLAGLDLLAGAPERAAVLLGAAAALRGWAVAGDPDVARIAAGCRAALGAAGCATASSRGAALSRDDLLALLAAPPVAASPVAAPPAADPSAGDPPADGAGVARSADGA